MDEQRAMELRTAQAIQARKTHMQNGKDGNANPVASAMDFKKKISEHWIVLVIAGFFDIIALIPFVSIATNPAFGLILFLYFGPKSKGGSEFLKIVLPTGIGTILDTVSSAIPFADLIPFNIGVALFRIALS